MTCIETKNKDDRKLVREGTSQEDRLAHAPNPASAPIDEHGMEHDMVFAQAYSAFLKYYDSSNAQTGDWKPFFSDDASVLLAVAAVQDVDFYRQRVRECTAFLKDENNKNDISGLRDRLDCLFSCCATLAVRLDFLKEKLPGEIILAKILKNLVQSQLAPALKRLVSYHRGGESSLDDAPLNDSSKEKAASFDIIGEAAIKFSALDKANLSKDWTDGQDWKPYFQNIAADSSVYGSETTVFERIKQIATHNLFTSVFDQFLKVYARTVSEAKRTIEKTIEELGSHEPHYALFLAFLRLFEYARTEINTLTERHLDFYYREILRLTEKDAEPGKTHLLVELAKLVPSHSLKVGELFKAGKDSIGKDVFFANNRNVVVNQAKVAALKTVYRHDGERADGQHQGGIYASPVANSDDGLGAALTSEDQSWQPFFNKIYQDGKLSEIRMPKEEIGFAIASHYLLMAEGERTVVVKFSRVSSYINTETVIADNIIFSFSGEKGWFNATGSTFNFDAGEFVITINLSGADPAVISYSEKTHGYKFQTDLPILLVKLKQQDAEPSLYDLLKGIEFDQIDLTVDVQNLKSLAVSNDFGPVDTSKPFQPFGASPIRGSALIIGSMEIFQKKLSSFILDITWQVKGSSYPQGTLPNCTLAWLNSGLWSNDTTMTYPFFVDGEKKIGISDLIVESSPDFSVNAFYSATARNGFVRISLANGFGQSEYQKALTAYLIGQSKRRPCGTDPGSAPAIPIIASLSIRYTTEAQIIDLKDSTSDVYADHKAYFFHIAPFGQAEQNRMTLNKAEKIHLLPQFSFSRDEKIEKSEAEFYIGITGLKLPQNLSLLFQVADGTANPLVKKPTQHIHWSYLCNNDWASFEKNQVDDQTGGLINSGIVTFSVPRNASDANTLLPSGMHWIRAAVASASDAVCRLRMVAAQAVEATFIDKGNDPAFSAKPLAAGTISKLNQPYAAVKKITQPFETLGGQGKETSAAFYARVSERLRHKDRAITLWDYERLVLEAFPQIHKVKCLNHTEYEGETYRELAPCHVTIVTIPNQEFRNFCDPLRPYTNLGLLEEIASFLRRRLSCFIKLHVKNPQFEEVRVSCKVRFYKGFEETFYLNKLKEDITKFMSPWAFSGDSSPTFGGKIYKSVLINFAEERPYVDYVNDFKLFHVYNDIDDKQCVVERNEIEASNAVSILVSAKHHEIDPDPINQAKTKIGKKCPCPAA